MSTPRTWWRRAMLMGIGLAATALTAASTSRYAARPAASAPIATAEDTSFHCATVTTDAWSPLPGLEYTGRLNVALPASPNAALVFIIGDAVPLDIEAETADGTPVSLQREPLRAGLDPRTPADFWLGDNNPWSAPGVVVRITVDALSTTARTISLRLGRRAPRVLARARNYAAGVSARVCAAGIPASNAFRTESALVVQPTMREYFATGWTGAEAASWNGQSQGVVRWMGEHGVVLVPSERRGVVRVVLRASVPEHTAEEPLRLKLTVNDTLHLAGIPVTRERHRYAWTIPAHAWVAGVNELLFELSPAPSNRRALAFEKLELSLDREQLDVEHQR